MLVLNPDIVDTSGMELSVMETVHTMSLHSIQLRFMKMSRNHGTSEHVKTRHPLETPMVEHCDKVADSHNWPTLRHLM